MLFILMEEIELSGGHIKIMLFIEIAKLKLTGGNIGNMLVIEMKKKFPGSHIEIMPFI